MRIASALRWAYRSPRAERNAIVDRQARLLGRLIRHAYARVPYYRSLFDRAGIKPEQIRTLADLARIPITSKADLVNLPPEQVLALGSNPRTLIARSTSGSSGPSFTTWRAPGEELVSELQQLRIRRYFGLRPRDTQVVALMDNRVSKSSSRLHRLVNRLGLHRTIWLNPLLPPEEFLRRLGAIRPDVIIGLAGPIARLADHLDDRARSLIHPKHLITTGEVLTASMRRKLSEAFQAPVYDKYACSELGHIAWECKQTGELHTSDDHLITEVLRKGRAAAPGERGELVITGLHYYAMPFIRYQLADVATRGREQCACGEPFATVRAIEGRMIDYFHLPDGRVIHPYELGGAAQQSLSWLKEVQMIQLRRDLIEANIVATKRPPPEEIERGRRVLASLLGDQVEMRVRFVDAIDWGPTGKLRQFRSEVSSEYTDLDWDSL